MDTRMALENGTELIFTNHENGTVKYLIQNEIGRGGSCIVYDASYVNNAGQKKLVRIKECYPFKLNITRNEKNSLVSSENDKEAFQKYIHRMKHTFYLCNELFYTEGLTNSISNTLDIYSANETIYVVSTYLQGKTLESGVIPTLKECVLIVKSVAKIIQKLHKRGYLYLDMKPDNIFVLDGINELIQLFDFDSIMPINKSNEFVEECDFRISYTKGFAALEQQMGEIRHFGRHTDVYGIGALLYYMLFGFPPSAMDCDWDAAYDFDKSLYSGKKYQDVLFDKITTFFHYTLANYYGDRYQDMEQLIEKLEEIEKYADTIVPYIISTPISSLCMVTGREKELSEIENWIKTDTSNCLFVTGMGGIGKSTLVQEYILRNKKIYDTILFLYFEDSIEKTITDDEQLVINMVEKNDEESITDYFKRKLKILRTLTANQNVLLVIDNFIGEPDDAFFSILNINWKVIFISRQRISQTDFAAIELGAIEERKNLYDLFEYYIGYTMEEAERIWLDCMIDRTAGHTLTLVLIAKQIANSHLSMREAALLAKQNGFTNMVSDKVQYLKDHKLYYEKISKIMNALFSFEHVTMEKKVILRALSMFMLSGIDIHAFTEILEMESKDEINALIRDGWADISGRQLFLHPLISEIILNWELTKEYEVAAIKMMKAVLRQLQLSVHIENVTNHDTAKYQTFREWMRISEGILKTCEREEVLRNASAYKELLYFTIIHMPRDREGYILEHAKELFTDNNCINDISIMQLYERLLHIYTEQMSLDKAYRVILQVKKTIYKSGSRYIKASYYHMLATYYDARLQGAYYDDNEYADVKNMLAAIDKSIFYIKKEKNSEGSILLSKCLLSKALVSIRCFTKKKHKIKKVLNLAENIIEINTPDYSELRYEYKVVKAWYYTLVEADINRMIKLMSDAYDMAKVIVNTKLNIIDDILIPWANMFFEWQQYDKSIDCLNEAVEICKTYKEVIPYIRKKLDLYFCMLDVYFETEKYEKCKEMIGFIEEENEKNKEFGIEKEIALTNPKMGR